MPYIKKAARKSMSAGCDPETPGELNYVISSLVGEYIQRKGESYTTHNEVLGVLTCVQLELYRRLTGPYEDVKLKENGDIFSYAVLERTNESD